MLSIPPALQFVLAVIIVVLLLIIAYAQYNKEKLAALRDAGKLKKKVVIFTGIKDFKSNKDEEYETLDKNVGTYRDLANSVNQDSGNEYTYNFWMYYDQDNLTSDADPNAVFGNYTTPTANVKPDEGLNSTYLSNGQRHRAPLILFMRGDPRLYYYYSACQTRVLKQDVLVKNPLVKLEKGGDVLTVEFNTVSSPEARKPCGSTGNWDVANSHKIGVTGMINDNLNNKWFMVTIVIQETNPTLGLSSRNQTQCTIYVNGKKKSTQRVSGAPVGQQSGNFYFNKHLKVGQTAYSIAIDNTAHGTSLTDRSGKLMMSDLTYFNYAADEAEVMSMYNAGFNRESAPAYSRIVKDSDVFGADSNEDLSKPVDDVYPEIGSFKLA